MNRLGHELRLRSVHGVSMVVALLLLAAGCGDGGKDASSDQVAALVSRMPQDGPGFLIVPHPAEAGAKLNEVGRTLDSPEFREEVAELLAEQGVEIPAGETPDMNSVLEALGIDGARPLGFALTAWGAEGIAYVPLQSEEAFRHTIARDRDSDPFEVSVAGEAVEANRNSDYCWFIADGYAVVAENKTLLQKAAEAFGAPVESVRHIDGIQKETDRDAVLLVRLDHALGDELKGSVAAAGLLGEWYTDVVASLSLAPEGEPSTFSLRGYKRAAGDTVPGPLQLRHATGPETLLNVSLQQCASLADLGFAFSRDGAAPVGGPSDLIKTILGDSVALSVDMGPAGLPVLKLSSTPVTQEDVASLLGLVPFQATPSEEYSGVQLYTLNGLPPMYGVVSYGLKDDILVASNSPAAVRALVDGLAAPPAATAGAPNRAEVMVDIAKGAGSPMMMMAMAMGMGGDPGLPGENPLANMPPVTLRAWEHPDSLEVELKYALITTGYGDIFGRARAGRSAAHSASSQNNQKQIGLICKMYANESQDEYFPPLMEAPGHLMFAATDAEDYREGRGIALYPEYLLDTTILVNPGAKDSGEWLDKAKNDPVSAVDDQHYVYLGYAVRDDADMDAYTQAYLNSVAEGAVPNADLEHNGRQLFRLREGVERHFIDEANGVTAAAQAQAEIPLMMERPGVWEDGEINVLYFDGHVAKVAAGEFPNTDAFWANVARINSKK